MSSISRFICVIKFPMNLKYRSSYRWCPLNKIFLKTSQYSQENICAGVFFNKITGLQACTLLKRYSNTGVFLWTFQTLRTPILKNICERLLLIVVINCRENWIKIFRNQIGLFFLLKHKIICCHSLSFVVTRCTTRLSFYKLS